MGGAQPFAPPCQPTSPAARVPLLPIASLVNRAAPWMRRQEEAAPQQGARSPSLRRHCAAAWWRPLDCTAAAANIAGMAVPLASVHPSLRLLRQRRGLQTTSGSRESWWEPHRGPAAPLGRSPCSEQLPGSLESAGRPAGAGPETKSWLLTQGGAAQIAAPTCSLALISASRRGLSARRPQPPPPPVVRAAASGSPRSPPCRWQAPPADQAP